MPTERKVVTPYGTIFYGGPCRDDYSNFVTYDQGGGHTVLTLQAPAMHAFKRAESRAWAKLHRLRARRGEHGRDPIPVLPGTNRLCATQTRLYESDPNRYAKPEVTGHTRGLAVDRDRRVSRRRNRIHHQALLAEGWTQVRPTDEPWHYSYGLTI